MSALTFSFVIIIALNWQFKRSKKKLDLKNSAGLGTMRQGVQQYGIFAKYATRDASVTMTTFKMSRGGGGVICLLMAGTCWDVALLPAGMRYALTKAGMDSSLALAESTAEKAKRENTQKPKAVRLKRILTPISAETKSTVGAGIRFFFFIVMAWRFLNSLARFIPQSNSFFLSFPLYAA